MENKKYKLRILPIFERDLNDIVDYIVFKLKNPDAANSLVDNVEKAIYKRLEYPEAFEKFNSSRKRKHSYYRIFVKNYIIFYVVLDDIMEVRRILYSKRNLDKELWYILKKLNIMEQKALF